MLYVMHEKSMMLNRDAAPFQFFESDCIVLGLVWLITRRQETMS